MVRAIGQPLSVTTLDGYNDRWSPGAFHDIRAYADGCWVVVAVGPRGEETRLELTLVEACKLLHELQRAADQLADAPTQTAANANR